MKPYREYDFEMWCRHRAEAHGGDSNGALYWYLYHRERHTFEAELRQQDRAKREASDLVEAFG